MTSILTVNISLDNARDGQPAIIFGDAPPYYRVSEGRWVTSTGMHLRPDLTTLAEQLLNLATSDDE